MNRDLALLEELLRDYAEHGHTGIAEPQAAASLERVERAWRGRENRAPIGLATLLAGSHLARYQLLPPGDDQAALTGAIRWYRRVLRLDPSRVPRELRELFDTGAFGPDVPEFDDPDLLPDGDLDAAVQQLEILGQNGQPRWAITLAAYLATRYERLGGNKDLERAIDLGREVLRRGGATPAEVLAARGNLAGAMLNRYTETTHLDALDEAIALYSVSVTERGSAADHANLGMALLTRHEVAGGLPTLEGAVEHARESVALTSPGDPSRAARLSNLAATLRASYDETGDDAHLDEAVRLAEHAVEASDVDDPALARRLSNLSAALTTRFEKRGWADDIDRAIEIGQASVASGPYTGHFGRVSNLLLALHLRGAATGNVADLQEALAQGRRAAAELPVGHADRADLLTNASGAAMTWFDWTGDIAAIDEAVDLSREAMRSQDDTPRAGLFHTNLSMHLLTRHEVAGSTADLDEAIRHAEAGVDALVGRGTPIALSNLAVTLRTRFEIHHRASDLGRAITAARAAVAATPTTERDRAAFEINLALCLWQADARLDALEFAWAALHNPLVAGTPSHAAYAANVARMLTELGGAADDIDALWSEVSADATAPVPLRIEAHVALADRAGRTSEARASDLAAAVALIPAAAWHGVGVPSRLRRLREWQGIGRDAAAAALGVHGPGPGLRLLEDSLSQVWARAVPTGQASRLRLEHPELAMRVDQLRVALSR